MMPNLAGDWTPSPASEWSELAIPGVYLYHGLLFNDERGHFRKVISPHLLSGQGPTEVFYSISSRGVLRGMHYSTGRAHSSKSVTVLQGSVLDVVIDLRRDHTPGKTIQIPLTQGDPTILLPSGVAHGFQAMEDNTLLLYATQNPHESQFDSGIHPLSCDVQWPLEPAILSKRDMSHPTLSDVLTSYLR